MKKIYLETSLIGFMTARLNKKNPSMMLKQMLTLEWWEKSKNHYNFFVSATVIKEIRQGDSKASQERIEFLKSIVGLELLPYNEEINYLAQEYANLLQLSYEKRDDAFHIAYAVNYEMDFLLTWNQTHIKNEDFEEKIKKKSAELKKKMPAILTPNDMLTLEKFLKG